MRFQDWWIENVFEELDSPEEWFFNETTAKLYVPRRPQRPLLCHGGTMKDYTGVLRRRYVQFKLDPIHRAGVAA